MGGLEFIMLNKVNQEKKGHIISFVCNVTEVVTRGQGEQGRERDW
jgi:hypothetical protein